MQDFEDLGVGDAFEALVAEDCRHGPAVRGFMPFSNEWMTARVALLGEDRWRRACRAAFGSGEVEDVVDDLKSHSRETGRIRRWSSSSISPVAPRAPNEAHRPWKRRAVRR